MRGREPDKERRSRGRGPHKEHRNRPKNRSRKAAQKPRAPDKGLSIDFMSFMMNEAGGRARLMKKNKLLTRKAADA